MRKLEVPFDIDKLIAMEDVLADIYLEWPSCTVSQLPVPMHPESVALFEIMRDAPMGDLGLLLDLTMRTGPNGTVLEADTFVEFYGFEPIRLREVQGILRKSDRQRLGNLPEADFMAANLSEMPKDVKKQALGIEKLLLSEIEAKLLELLGERLEGIFAEERHYPAVVEDGFKFITGWLTEREIYASGSFFTSRHTNRVGYLTDENGSFRKVDLPDITYQVEFKLSTDAVLLAPKVRESFTALFDDDPEIVVLAEMLSQLVNLNLVFHVTDHNLRFRLNPKPVEGDPFWQLWVLSLLIEWEGDKPGQENFEQQRESKLSSALWKELSAYQDLE